MQPAVQMRPTLPEPRGPTGHLGAGAGLQDQQKVSPLTPVVVVVVVASFVLDFVFYSSRGWGIRALNAIPKGSFICTYVGAMYDELTAVNVSSAP